MVIAMTSRQSACRKIEILLDAFRDGELSARERQTVDKHLAACPGCQARLVEIERLVASLRSLPRYEPGRDFSAHIESLATPRQRAAVVRLRPLFWTALGAGAAAAAVLVFVFQLTPQILPARLLARQPGRSAIMPHSRPEERPRPTVVAPSSREGARERPGAGGKPEALVATSLGEKSGPGAPGPAAIKQEPGRERAGQEPDPSDRQSARREPDREPAPALRIAERPQGGRGVYYGSVAADSVLDHDSPFAYGAAAVVALAEGDQTCITGALGLETDEDGLYAIRM